MRKCFPSTPGGGMGMLWRCDILIYLRGRTGTMIPAEWVPAYLRTYVCNSYSIFVELFHEFFVHIRWESTAGNVCVGHETIYAVHNFLGVYPKTDTTPSPNICSLHKRFPFERWVTWNPGNGVSWKGRHRDTGSFPGCLRVCESGNLLLD